MYLLKGAFLFIFVFSIFSCSKKEDLEINVYRKALYKVSDNVFPEKAVTTSEQMISNLIFDGLFKSVNLKVIPSLVEKWSSSDKGATYNFKIKKNVKFHNGKSLEVDDVIKSLERLKKDDGHVKQSFKIIESILKKDEQSFTIKLKRAYPPFISLLASPFAKIYIIDEKGRAIGTGAFKIEKISDNKSHKILQLMKNTNYHGQKPAIKTLELWELGEKEALELAKKGIIHDTSIYLSNLNKNDINSKVKIEESLIASTWLFSFNTSILPTSNAKLRRCVTQNFKKKEFLAKFFPTHSMAMSYLPPILLGSKANVSNNKEEDCTEFKNIKLNIDMPKELAESRAICDWIVKKHPTFIFNCKPIKFEKLIQNIIDKKSNMSFLAMHLEFPDVEYFFSTFEGQDGSFNLSNYRSENINTSLDEARNSVDRKKRNIIYEKLNQYVSVKSLVLNVSHPIHRSLRHSCLKGYEVNLSGETYIDYTSVKLSGDCKFLEDFR